MLYTPKLRQPDGQVLNSNLKINNINQSASSPWNNFGIYKAMLLEAKYKDEDGNQYKHGVEYTAVITGGPRSGEFLSNVMPLDGFGGKDNYSEIVYTPKTKVLKGKNEGDSTPPENTDGSYVLIGFLGGHQSRPVILGGLKQPNNENYGANIDDSVLYRGQVNGMAWKISKDGILTVNREGTTITIDSTGNGVTISSDKAITINSSDSITLGSGGEPFVLGNAMASLFNSHTHSGPPPDQTMGSGEMSSLITGS